MDPFRGANEALPIRVFADLDQDLADSALDGACRRSEARAIALDLDLRSRRDLADLGLDLVDDRTDVLRQLRRADTRSDSSSVQAAMVRRSAWLSPNGPRRAR
jgi:hypothetical protein